MVESSINFRELTEKELTVVAGGNPALGVVFVAAGIWSLRSCSEELVQKSQEDPAEIMDVSGINR